MMGAATPTDANGDADWDITAWSGVPPGRTLYFQVAVVDPVGPDGKALSNALSFVRP